MSAEEFKEAGNQKFARRDFDGAEELYSKAIELDSNNACYYCNRAAARLALGKNSQALADSSLALQRDPNYSKAYYRRGMAHLTLGNVVEAKCDFETAQQLEPSKVTLEKSVKKIDLLLERGKELTEKQEWESATSIYQSALSISPGLVAAKLGLGDVYLGQKKYQEASTLAGQLLQDHANHTGGLLLRAKALYYMNQVQSIAPLVSNILRLDPDNKEAFQLHKKSQAMKRLKDEGNNYFQSKNYEQALEAYSQALEVDSSNVAFNSVLFYNKGLVKNSMGDLKGAVKELDLAIEANPDYGKAYKLRAQVNTSLKNYQEAVRDYHEASTREPDNRELKKQLKDAQSRLKEAEKKDYYGIMELDKNADKREIDRQYKKLAMKYHPDEDTKAEMDKKFKDLGEAYAVLSDDQKRSRYDNGMDINGGGGVDMSDFNDIFAQHIFRGGFGGGGGFGGFGGSNGGGFRRGGGYGGGSYDFDNF